MSLMASQIAPALLLWDETTGSAARLLTDSENQIFIVETPDRGAFVLRVHRVGYQTRAAIESELAWLEALQRDTDIVLSHALAGRDGRLVQAFETAEGEPRMAVLFGFIAGEEPSIESDLTATFRTLGRYAATMHVHALNWQKPAGFERPEIKAATILDVDSPWGDWRMAPGVDPSVRRVLNRLDAALWRRLADYGVGEDRFGLIHADMRLGNLLQDASSLALIDFDDCGFSWFTYDFAAAISFHEMHPSVPALKAAWLDGYRPIRALSPADLASMDAMVMLRRMALLAWIGTHIDTRLAQTHVEGFAAGTAELAERYLRGPLWS